jgi:hypothetical protein
LYKIATYFEYTVPAGRKEQLLEPLAQQVSLPESLKVSLLLSLLLLPRDCRKVSVDSSVSTHEFSLI